jgi:hypothetical protein
MEAGSGGNALKLEPGDELVASDNAVRSILVRELIVSVDDKIEKGVTVSITLTKRMNQWSCTAAACCGDGDQMGTSSSKWEY